MIEVTAKHAEEANALANKAAEAVAARFRGIDLSEDEWGTRDRAKLVDAIAGTTGLVAWIARAESAEAERDRYKAALAMVRAHTGRLPLASRDLLDGLLSSIERITDKALAAAEVQS